MVRIAIMGGSFDPPGRHHRDLAESLSARFDQVIVVPTGIQVDKADMADTPAIYRASLADMTFRGLPEG